MRDTTADLLLALTDFVLTEKLTPTEKAHARVMLKVKAEAVARASGGQRQKTKVTDVNGVESDGS